MSKGFETIHLHGCASGTIPTPVIGENGNWYIGNDDTGVRAQGEKGDKGEIDAINNQTPTYVEATEPAELTSGEKVSVAFGKLAKAVRTLLEHVGVKATDSISGHTKLSSSPAITEHNAYALDAVEKNVEVTGTLAHRIEELNGKISKETEILEKKLLVFISGTTVAGQGAVRLGKEVMVWLEFSMNTDFIGNTKIATLPYKSEHQRYGILWASNNQSVSIYTAGTDLYMQSNISIPAGTAFRGGIDFFTLD